MRDRFTSIIRGMDEISLLAALQTYDRSQLLVLHERFGLKDCRCPVKLGPCSCGEASCDCPVGARLIPCQHTTRAAESPLPFSAHVFLLHYLWPAEYQEPLPPLEPSPALLARAKVQDFLERHAAGRGLWHDLDALRRDYDPTEGLGADRQISNLRNGAPIFGQLRRRQ